MASPPQPLREIRNLNVVEPPYGNMDRDQIELPGSILGIPFHQPQPPGLHLPETEDFSLKVFCIPIKSNKQKIWQPKKWLNVRGNYGEIAQVCNTEEPPNCNYVMKIIKLDPADPHAETNFWNEVKFQTEAAKAHLAPKVLDSWVCEECKKRKDDECPYIGVIIMPALKRTVKDLFKDPDILPLEKKKYLIEAFTVLETLNNKGIIHRDAHLDNFMIDSKGKVNIIDFGFATDNSDLHSPVYEEPYFRLLWNMDDAMIRGTRDPDWESIAWLTNQYKKNENILSPKFWKKLNNQTIKLFEDIRQPHDVHTYLTPKNKNDPPCHNPIGTDEKNEECYLNPFIISPRGEIVVSEKYPRMQLRPGDVAKCLYYDNWWQEYENNICFPKYSKEEQNIEELNLPNNPSDKAIRQASLKNHSLYGIIPNIEFQLQESSSFKVPKILTGKRSIARPMTKEDFDGLNHTFGEKVSGPLPPRVDPYYTRHDKVRFRGTNPLPIIENRYEYNLDKRHLEFIFQGLLCGKEAPNNLNGAMVILNKIHTQVCRRFLPKRDKNHFVRNILPFLRQGWAPEREEGDEEEENLRIVDPDLQVLLSPVREAQEYVQEISDLICAKEEPRNLGDAMVILNNIHKIVCKGLAGNPKHYYHAEGEPFLIGQTARPMTNPARAEGAERFKPTILVLQSRYDPERAFDKDGDLGLFTMFRKLEDYQFVHKYFTTMDDIERIFEQLPAKKIAHLVIMAHGTAHSLRFSKVFNLRSIYQRDLGLLTPEFYRFGELLRHYLLPDASILLHSCSIGQGGPMVNNFAQNLANIVPNHTIYAAEQKIHRGDLLVNRMEPNKDNMTLEMNYLIDPKKNNKIYPFRREESGNCALIQAVQMGYGNIVDRLLEAKEIDVNQQDRRGNTALILAVSTGHENIVDRLLEVNRIEVNQPNNDGNTALIVAVYKGHENIVYRLLDVDRIKVNQPNNNGNTALMVAASKGHENIVDRLLVVDGIEVNIENNNGDTALILAVATGHRPIVALLLDVEEIEVNHPNQNGDTALILASEKGHENIVDRLLEVNRIKVNIENKNGNTALILASRRGYRNIVTLLLEFEKERDQ